MTSGQLRTAGTRNIVITGAGRGLGLGLVRCFTERGDRVIGTARTPDGATELAELADRVLPLDVSSDQSIAAAATALAELGHIDVLINNAGINAGAVGAASDERGIRDLSREDFLAVMDVNAAGPMLVTRALVPLLVAADGAMVINVSSQLGAMTFGDTHGGDIAYNASKSALNMVTVRSATDLAADGIGVVCVHPGWVRTDMGGPSASLGVAESAAALAETTDRLTLADSGRFLRWDGTTHAW
ncbi:MAG: SDR family NAD(P)-dependent oxidoreductase [Actinomycetota bacterium]